MVETTKKVFEVKKWNAVALWAWGKYRTLTFQRLISTCVLYAKRSSTSHASTVRQIKPLTKNASYPGARATTPSISTASTGGSKQEVFALWTTRSGTTLGMVANDYKLKTLILSNFIQKNPGRRLSCHLCGTHQTGNRIRPWKGVVRLRLCRDLKNSVDSSCQPEVLRLRFLLKHGLIELALTIKQTLNSRLRLTQLFLFLLCCCFCSFGYVEASVLKNLN